MRQNIAISLGAVIVMAISALFGIVPLTAISTPFGFSGHACGTLPMRLP